MKADGEQRYSSTHSSLQPLDGGEWSVSCLIRFTSGKELCYPLYRRLGGLQSWSGQFGEQKNLMPIPGFEPQAFQPIDFHGIT
jgi:hypothetical protein